MKADRVYDYLSVVRRPILSRNESVEGSSSLGASPSLALAFPNMLSTQRRDKKQLATTEGVPRTSGVAKGGIPAVGRALGFPTYPREHVRQ